MDDRTNAELWAQSPAVRAALYLENREPSDLISGQRDDLVSFMQRVLDCTDELEKPEHRELIECAYEYEHEIFLYHRGLDGSHPPALSSKTPKRMLASGVAIETAAVLFGMSVRQFEQRCWPKCDLDQLHAAAQRLLDDPRRRMNEEEGISWHVMREFMALRYGVREGRRGSPLGSRAIERARELRALGLNWRPVTAQLKAENLLPTVAHAASVARAVAKHEAEHNLPSTASAPILHRTEHACPQGHPWTEDNPNRKGRMCKVCRAERKQAKRASTDVAHLSEEHSARDAEHLGGEAA